MLNVSANRVFHSLLAEMAILYSKDLTTAKKVNSSGARPDARDYH